MVWNLLRFHCYPEAFWWVVSRKWCGLEPYRLGSNKSRIPETYLRDPETETRSLKTELRVHRTHAALETRIAEHPSQPGGHSQGGAGGCLTKKHVMCNEECKEIQRNTKRVADNRPNCNEVPMDQPIGQPTNQPARSPRLSVVPLAWWRHWCWHGNPPHLEGASRVFRPCAMDL